MSMNLLVFNYGLFVIFGRLSIISDMTFVCFMPSPTTDGGGNAFLGCPSVCACVCTCVCVDV